MSGGDVKQLGETAYEHALEAAQYLLAAEKPIRILRSVSWSPSCACRILCEGRAKTPRRVLTQNLTGK